MPAKPTIEETLRVRQTAESLLADQRMAPNVTLADVQWRVDSKPYPKGDHQVARYVPYLDASTVAALFDRWVGPEGWEDTYREGTLNGRPVLWCTITVNGRSKTDVGVPPGGDEADLADKGLVSDAFKRCACLKWGVGRNVYRLPTLWARCDVADGKARAPRGIEDELVDLLRRAGWADDGSRL